MIDISIITVTHQSAPYIADLIRSALSGAYEIGAEHLIVDNGSTDGTAEEIESQFSHTVALIKNRENLGFSKANNQAAEKAQGRYLLFLNPDMHLEEGSLDRLVKWMDASPDIGVAGCKLVDERGDLLKNSLPRPLPRWWRELAWLCRIPLKTPPFPIPQQPVEVEALKGAFMLVRREIIERLGFAFDPRYFLLFEDMDLCREVRQLGYKIYFNPHVQCTDFNSRSFAQKPSRWIFNHYTQSMLAYFRKWEPWPLWIWIALAIPLGAFLRFPFSRKI